MLAAVLCEHAPTEIKAEGVTDAGAVVGREATRRTALEAKPPDTNVVAAASRSWCLSPIVAKSPPLTAAIFPWERDDETRTEQWDTVAVEGAHGAINGGNRSDQRAPWSVTVVGDTRKKGVRASIDRKDGGQGAPWMDGSRVPRENCWPGFSGKDF
ncbi:hypothetical protein S83_026548 [Arachis hypogaea]